LSVEASRSRILDKLAGNSSAVTTNGQVAITRDQSDTRRVNMEAALLYRSDPGIWTDLRPKAKEYNGMTLLDMARECLDAAGVRTRGMNRHDIAKFAVQGRFVIDSESEDYFAHSAGSTSDFPNILSNVAKKSLRTAYDAFASTYKPIGRQVTATDFKPKFSLQLSDIAALPLVNEDGEYNRTLPTESKESYSINTYGQIVAITRKVIINDDLGAFTRIPALLGQSAARMEADKVWALITANGNLSDGNAIFSVAHGNLRTGSGSTLTADNLVGAKTVFRNITAPKGTILNLVPKYLVVPAALEGVADQLMASLSIAAATYTSVVPNWIRSLEVIVEPRLDANSTTAWYLIADPRTIDGIEYCYLEGQEGIYTETRQGFEVDGVEVKARLDFGTAVVEYRGLQKNAGV
jgi:phage major head subunit gpT-like protein